MVWYEILAALEAALTEKAVARIVKIGAPASETFDLAPDDTGRYGAVLLARGKETEEQLFHGGEGNVFFYMENWVQPNDANPAEGYRLLAEQEERCRNALAAFFSLGVPVGGADIVYAEVKKIIGVADSANSRMGSRATIKVQWSKRTV